MKYLVAVSGGIDSVALLDVLARDRKYDLIVAHFDHGIREDSADDARFVAGLAAAYDLPFVTKREELGAQAGEELARRKRYEFLRAEAKKHDATIVTAHHQGDVIESIVINLARGTGWRGLAVLGARDIRRPLLGTSKTQIRQYATANRLEWVEDSTNASTKYLRNRLRRHIQRGFSQDQKQAVIDLWRSQQTLKDQINHELEALLQKDGTYSRHLLIMIDPLVAIELLRSAVVAKNGWTPTRPQAARALLAIKTARPGAVFEIGDRAKLRFTIQTFIVETP